MLLYVNFVPLCLCGKKIVEVRNFNLYIAGYNLRFESSDDGPELVPSERFLNFLCYENYPDVLIRVHSGRYIIPLSAKKVFDAPYVEEINGIRIKKSDRFWSIHRLDKDLYINAVFPFSNEQREAVLHFSLEEKEWELWLNTGDDRADPIEYPLDGLILYYLTVIHHDIFIHASGVRYNGIGYLFSGISGKGKTTMAKLWKIPGSKIIHDDRLIIRKAGGDYVIYNTPVYNNDEPFESTLNKIFIIEHGRENRITSLRGAEAVSKVLSNCIQHNWERSIITYLLDSVTDLISSVPVAQYCFLPQKSAVDHILENER